MILTTAGLRVVENIGRKELDYLTLASESAISLSGGPARTGT